MVRSAQRSHQSCKSLSAGVLASLRLLLCYGNVRTIPLNNAIAEQAADLRARYKLRTHDATRLATALRSGAAWFLTSDAELPEIPGIPNLTLNRLT